MVDIKDFLINVTLVQYNVTNSIISSHIRHHRLLPPTAHFTSPQSLSRAQRAVFT